MIKFAVIHLRLTVTVTVGGAAVVFDAAQFASTFAENSIPSASALLSVGLQAKTGEVAKIHTHINSMRESLPVVVTLIPTVSAIENAQSGVELNPPAGAGGFVIFRGKTSGGGWQRTAAGAYFVLHMQHWLADLHYGSALCASVHPGGINNFVWPSVTKELELSGGGTGSGVAGWLPQLKVEDDYHDDLWGNVLHPWLVAISKQDSFDLVLNQPGAGGGPPSNTSPDVVDALNRIRPNAAGKLLKLRTDGADNALLQGSIRRALEAESPSTWQTTTLWGKIVGDWASQYMFTVSPRVEDALIVPFTGPTKADPFLDESFSNVQTVIDINDYVGGNTYAPMPQRLRAVGIVHALATTLAGVPLAESGVMALYPDPPETKGAVLLKAPPPWVNYYVTTLLSDDASRTQGGDGTPISTALDEEGTGQPPENPIAPEVAAKQPTNILRNFAKQWYAIESLKGRSAEITGKLRFDIAPGSQILVQGATGRNLNAADDGLAVPFVATASQITYTINAEQQQAGTVITLTHMRTLGEDAAGQFSMEESPLYADIWPGAVLVKDAIPEGT